MLLLKPIEPGDIKSLTERAFFRVFNPKRSILSDQQMQKQDEKAQVAEVKVAEERLASEECICEGKGVGRWVKCDRESCKGSSWYHMSCIGIDQDTDMKDRIWVCPVCEKA
jgi:hypothetical protein